jgi:hypothetical protein
MNSSRLPEALARRVANWIQKVVDLLLKIVNSFVRLNAIRLIGLDYIQSMKMRVSLTTPRGRRYELMQLSLAMMMMMRRRRKKNKKQERRISAITRSINPSLSRTQSSQPSHTTKRAMSCHPRVSKRSSFYWKGFESQLRK